MILPSLKETESQNHLPEVTSESGPQTRCAGPLQEVHFMPPLILTSSQRQNLMKFSGTTSTQPSSKTAHRSPLPSPPTLTLGPLGDREQGQAPGLQPPSLGRPGPRLQQDLWGGELQKGGLKFHFNITSSGSSLPCSSEWPGSSAAPCGETSRWCWWRTEPGVSKAGWSGTSPPPKA